ncbi:MAG: type II toxin-antitoxin system HicB family antitoxin [Oscillospiraceae bacterium]|nr:type II toxin-antitoxin system HicB family antitoxin [Oscillospiraceae bacterium]
MLKIYPAIFYAEDTGYWVEFPNLEGCQTQGDSLEEAMLMAQEVLGLYLVSLEERKLPIPTPGNPATLTAPDGAFATLITTNMNLYRRNKSVKKTLTIPLWLNQKAEECQINFSGVLQEALMQKLDIAQ